MKCELCGIELITSDGLKICPKCGRTFISLTEGYYNGYNGFKMKKRRKSKSKTLDKIIAELELNDVHIPFKMKELAHSIMTMVRTKTNIKNTSYLAGASILIASRALNRAIPLKLILQVLRNLDYKISYNKFKNLIHLIERITGRKYIPKPQDYIPFICSRLGKDLDALQAEARKVLATLNNGHKNPIPVAALAVTIAAKKLKIPIKKKEIAEAAGIDPSVVRRVNRLLCPRTG